MLTATEFSKLSFFALQEWNTFKRWKVIVSSSWNEPIISTKLFSDPRISAEWSKLHKLHQKHLKSSVRERLTTSIALMQPCSEVSQLERAGNNVLKWAHLTSRPHSLRPPSNGCGSKPWSGTYLRGGCRSTCVAARLFWLSQFFSRYGFQLTFRADRCAAVSFCCWFCSSSKQRKIRGYKYLRALKNKGGYVGREMLHLTQFWRLRSTRQGAFINNERKK